MAKLVAREGKQHKIKDFSSLRSTNRLAAIKVPTTEHASAVDQTSATRSGPVHSSSPDLKRYG